MRDTTMLLLLLLMLLFLLRDCSASLGVDLTLPLTVEEWAELDPEFAIVRVTTHYGEMDITGIENLRRAMAAGVPELSGYMYPCIPSSYFATTGDVSCLSPSAQLDELISALAANTGSLEVYSQNTWPPTDAPTFAPTVFSQPTMAPTAPTAEPTEAPTPQPTQAPTETPTDAPTQAPSVFQDPTAAPTHAPTFEPSAAPTYTPSAAPSHAPSHAPSASPTHAPSAAPSETPTHVPTFAPSTQAPSAANDPTAAPTWAPSQAPTLQPTQAPTETPSMAPTVAAPLSLKRVFLMVEDESPPRYFDANQLVNQAYFKELVEKAYEYGIQLGVFTSLRYWTELMETDLGETVEFSRENVRVHVCVCVCVCVCMCVYLSVSLSLSHHPLPPTNPPSTHIHTCIIHTQVPLWTPRFDSTESMDFFVPFGGWDTPYMKQFKGGSSPARRQASTWRINENYVENALTGTTIDPV